MCSWADISKKDDENCTVGCSCSEYLMSPRSCEKRKHGGKCQSKDKQNPDTNGISFSSPYIIDHMIKDVDGNDEKNENHDCDDGVD